MRLTRIRLGDYIEKSTKNNKNLEYGEEFIEGVSNKGIFTHPKGNTAGVNLKPYKIIGDGDFVYNPTRLNIGSIAYRKEGACIVSHLYIVFHLTDEAKKIINPDYLFMYFRRNEFFREVTFRNYGSQRPEFSFNDMSDIIISLPPIDIQQKYVDIYNAMVENQKSYEEGLEDLKLVCDGYIVELKRKYPVESINSYIERKNEKNTQNKISHVMGISTKKEFREPQSRVDKLKLGNYKIVRNQEFTYVPTTDTWKVLAFALNKFNKDIVVSPIYEVFATDKDKLLPEYLAMWFSRKEFDRYARFHSWGSARETFTWDDMSEVEIPIPDLSIQQSIVNIYKVYQERKEINEKLKQQIKDICPILIKGSIEEARK